ncbi:DUF4259 domain-containing protein [Hymenobacter lapidiphilus]|uniref:DUF4259 domain-containing protein n=1 Tax=Hymenobacter lapidiphilus TaxID=2608003 RepID=A0A7Y7PL61_9BACT|nr:DUF4259 domain-containing protein [Hymenobacter lapidiphilus]NVO29780.1 DUF4259 domain-containing protein [Hymenobacter lapidiphilus]
MAAWGYYNFDNDTAADFAEDFKAEPSAGVLEQALAAVQEADGEYLDADIASEALAAAEIVAAILGKPARIFPNDLLGVIPGLNLSHVEPLRKPAQEAVRTILGPESELREFWEDSDEFENWEGLQRQLLKRLDKPGA